VNASQPEQQALVAFLARIRRRLATISAAEGIGAGLALASLAAFVLWQGDGAFIRTLVTGIVLALAGLAIGVVRSPSRRTAIAGIVEGRTTGFRNTLLTAAELMDKPGTTHGDIATLVFRDADARVAGIRPASLVSARRATGVLVLGAALWLGALMFVSASPAISSATAAVELESVAVSSIDVLITPPAYAGRQEQSFTNPSRIEALAGSSITLTVRAVAAAVTAETLTRTDTLAPESDGVYTGSVVADADGYIAIEASASDGRPGVRRLVGLTVIPDQQPRLQVTTPGHDLFLPEPSGSLDVTVRASDDIGLASLRLRYTKVTGFGERFTFVEGDVPLRITRTDSRNWEGRGAIPLSTMELIPGDVVVYRAIGTDNRPGATATESDSYLVEITSPGSVAADGFAIDDEIDRYAVSQQMVVIKTEQLLARRNALTPAQFAEEAVTIAAEQRRVRAQFIFMMGGELAEEHTDAVGISHLHEEHEAEAEDDILAGRLENRGRIEIIRAIRSMSLANASLIATEVPEALVQEKLALRHLQAAFSRTRYILRALSRREQLDLTRRLTGVLSEASRDVRPIAEATADPAIAALRAELAAIAELAASTGRPSDADFGADAAAAASPAADRELRPESASVRASGIAQRILNVNPASDPLRTVAALLTDAAAEMARARPRNAQPMLERAAIELAAQIRDGLGAPPAQRPALEADRLAGALADQLRTGPRGRQ
jgi:hypothetical protein